jgi:hypothetical protein
MLIGPHRRTLPNSGESSNARAKHLERMTVKE